MANGGPPQWRPGMGQASGSGPPVLDPSLLQTPGGFVPWGGGGPDTRGQGVTPPAGAPAYGQGITPPGAPPQQNDAPGGGQAGVQGAQVPGWLQALLASLMGTGAGTGGPPQWRPGMGQAPGSGPPPLDPSLLQTPGGLMAWGGGGADTRGQMSPERLQQFYSQVIAMLQQAGLAGGGQ